MYCTPSPLAGEGGERGQQTSQRIVNAKTLRKRMTDAVDGGQHHASETDQVRDSWLRAQGFKVLRFWNNEVSAQPIAVPERIMSFLPPSPNPLPRGEREQSGDTT